MTRSQQPQDEDDSTPTVRLARRALTLGEDVLYVAVAVLLVAGAVVVLVDATSSFLDLGTDTAATFALTLLDSLLLVFIFVELLAAVKLTLKRREIVAEPFLLVGILAAIKEIVVLSVEAADVIAGDKQAPATLTEIAVQIVCSAPLPSPWRPARGCYG